MAIINGLNWGKNAFKAAFTLAQIFFCSHLTQMGICCTRVNTKIRTRSNFFHIRSGPLSNVYFNRIHIRYLDILPTSKHTHPISCRTPNVRAACLPKKIAFQCRRAVCARILLRWKLYIGKKLHIKELVFNPCSVNFINAAASLLKAIFTKEFYL